VISPGQRHCAQNSPGTDVNFGYLEGIVRGFRNTLLTSSSYNNLTQCETIDDVKLQLGPAYGDFLSALPPNPSTSALADKTTEKLVAEFRYLQANAVGSLTKFMEYLTYGYMIDNVALLITGTLHERDTRELLDRCHPLGWFETMPGAYSERKKERAIILTRLNL
jgi:V-type H+-transporting ATPase subunit d